MEEEQNAVERCMDIIAEGLLVRLLVRLDPLTPYELGGCDVEADYAGPKLDVTEDGKYTITQEFISSMMDWFKRGKKLPRRYVWEIILGAHSYFEKEDSLVNLDLVDGITCDVIGDVHGAFPGHIHAVS